MKRVSWLGALIVIQSHWGLLVRADSFSTVEIFSDANCQSIPLVVTIEKINTTCTTNETCSATEINHSAYYYAQRCATDRFEYTSSLFSGAKYLMIDGFLEDNCQTYARSNVFLAAGTCQLASYVGARSEIATLFNDGSAYMTIYNDSACGNKAQVFDLNASTIRDHSCFRGYNKFYSSIHPKLETASAGASANGSESESERVQAPTTSKMSAGALVGIVLACLAIVLLPALLIYWMLRQTKRQTKKKQEPNGTSMPDMALAFSDKHDNEERYAPDMSPQVTQRRPVSSQTAKSAPIVQSHELLRGRPLYLYKEEARSGKVWTDDRPSGSSGAQRDKVQGDAIGGSGRLHTEELCTTFERSKRLQREDLSDNPAFRDPIGQSCLKKDEFEHWKDHPDDRLRTLSDPLWSEEMQEMDHHPMTQQPIHAQRLRGPVTADSVCEDDAILSSRIPRDHVFVDNLIGRGGYGEVYKGTYEGRSVAVKMLFPETRKSTRHVAEFLTEVKMMTVMDHPCVVEFIGVSWNSLMDLCVVTEYMAGGDLRAWLSDRADNEKPVGFDMPKVKIATHVAHALAYLHSLTPSVIHRDLKSRNILLSDNQDAKLADFGASRERVDRTMTAGVGTSLWIAPEVMMGERYDDKADMFSFGVVLSELDSQQNPYAHAKENNPTGRKMPETAILQLVAMGKLRIEFSPGALKGVVQLGVACTAIDPTERPTAAEAFHKLQGILGQMAKKKGR